MTLTAIQTNYKGFLFRSRLEARWAVFFDALGIKWEYEPEGLVLSDGTYYLPDFRVITPCGDFVWYEIKPETTLTDAKFDRFAADVHMTNNQNLTENFTYACLLNGDPRSFLESSFPDGGLCPRCGIIVRDFAYGCYVNDDHVSIGCECCDATTPGGDGNPEEMGVTARSTPTKGMLVVDPLSWCNHLRLVANAANRARSARFEHGDAQ